MSSSLWMSILSQAGDVITSHLVMKSGLSRPCPVIDVGV